jgi:hypothetical protein
MDMQRHPSTVRLRIKDAATLNDNVAAPPIPYHDASGGILYVPSARGNLTITVYAAADKDVNITEPDTFMPLYDEDGVPVTMSATAGQAHMLPAAKLFGAHWLKFVAADVSEVVCVIGLKS